MAVVVLLLRPLGIVAAAAGGIAGYALMVPAIGILDSEDKRVLRALIRSSESEPGG